MTRSDVIGKWTGQPGDTIVINQDNSFSLINTVGDDKQNNTINTSPSGLTGKWILNKKSIHFDFADSTQNFGGGCTTYQYWWTRGSKRKLVRPMLCTSPTHEFRMIVKIN